MPTATPLNDPSDDEPTEARRESHAERADEKHRRARERQPVAAEPIGRPAAGRCTDHRPDEHAAGNHAFEQRREAEGLIDIQQCSGDDADIEAEQ
jgi:hypothetical protein